MKRAGLYVRISSDRDDTQLGVQRQEEDCRKLAGSLGWEVVEVYSDNDVSATKVQLAERPGGSRLLADLDRGRIDAVLAYSSSRLYRQVRDLEPLLLRNPVPDIRTVASGDVNLNTADGRMHARMLASIDQGEAERTAERVRRKKQQNREAGKWNGGGPRPFGYRRSNGSWELDESEAGELRSLAERALAGESIQSLVLDLNDRGVETPGGKRWRTTNLRRTLTSAFHAGTNAEGVECEWPAAISRAQHEALLRRFPPPREKPGRGKGPRDLAVKYPLSNIATCAACETGMPGSGGRYRCTPVYGGCGKNSIDALTLDRWAVDQVYAGREWILREEEDREAERQRRMTELEPLQSRAAAARSRLERAQKDYAEGELGAEDLRAVREILEEQVQELEAQVSKIEVPENGPNFAELLRFAESGEAEDWLDRWSRGELTREEVNELRYLFKQVIARVVVEPSGPARKIGGKFVAHPVEERVRIEWRGVK